MRTLWENDTQAKSKTCWQLTGSNAPCKGGEAANKTENHCKGGKPPTNTILDLLTPAQALDLPTPASHFQLALIPTPGWSLIAFASADSVQDWRAVCVNACAMAMPVQSLISITPTINKNQMSKYIFSPAVKGKGSPQIGCH